MPRLKFACILAILVVCFSAAHAQTATNAQTGTNAQTAANAPTDLNWPTDEEINLTLNQADRAVQRLKLMLDDQEMQIGKGAEDQVAEGRRVASELESVEKTLKLKPQGFNGPMGFRFFESLGAAYRSVLQCGVAASSQSLGYVTAAKPDKADVLFRLSQNCMDLSALIFTISEEVGALYKRYIQAINQLAGHSSQEARQCQDTLEKFKVKKFPSY